MLADAHRRAGRDETVPLASKARAQGAARGIGLDPAGPGPVIPVTAQPGFGKHLDDWGGLKAKTQGRIALPDVLARIIGDPGIAARGWSINGTGYGAIKPQVEFAELPVDTAFEAAGDAERRLDDDRIETRGGRQITRQVSGWPRRAPWCRDQAGVVAAKSRSSPVAPSVPSVSRASSASPCSTRSVRTP